MVNKKIQPRDMKDLEDIYYNQSNRERKKKYEKYADGEIIDPIREAYAKQIMTKLGALSKIKESTIKKPDYEIKEHQIVIEITSLQYSEEESVTGFIRPRSDEDFIQAVNKAIEHALEKDYSEYEGILRLCLFSLIQSFVP
ncbi:MAG: hypothetical protein ABSA75_08555 [Candidatus Bathyarchaeia archaeon]|jgi:hypothetical protein